MIHKRLVLLFVLLHLILGCDARAMSAEECKVAIASGTTPLVELKQPCQGSGYFELMMATEELNRGDLQSARQWVDAGLKADKVDAMPFYEIEFSVNVAAKTPELNRRMAEKFIEDHPEDAAGHLLMGKYFAVSGDLTESIRHLEQAAALRGEVAAYGANKLLVSGYWDADRLADGAAAFDRAEAFLPEAIYNDWTLTKMASASHFLSGNPARAQAILQHQLERHPESSEDKHVHALVRDLGKAGYGVKVPGVSRDGDG